MPNLGKISQIQIYQEGEVPQPQLIAQFNQNVRFPISISYLMTWLTLSEMAGNGIFVKNGCINRTLTSREYDILQTLLIAH